MKRYWGIAALTCALIQVPALKAEGVDGLTAQDLLNLMIQEGLIDKEKVAKLTEKVRERQRKEAEAPVEPAKLEERDVKPTTPGSVVRVPYIPEYIRDEIRDQVRIGLKEDVSRDVIAQAKQERWGIPQALPEWVNRIKLSGDMRLRYQGDYFGDNEVFGSPYTYLDVAAVNDAGTFDGLTDEELFLNTTEDRHRLRVRARLGLKAAVSNSVEVGMRLVTGNGDDPISTNQTLGNDGSKYEASFDLAYIKYTNLVTSFTASGGRIANPFYSTDLVWDNDLTFDGGALTWRFLRSDDMDDQYRQWDPFITLGAFAIDESDYNAEDKWLYAAQIGFDYDWFNQDRISAGVAYYDYDNIRGVRNAPDSFDQDFTAPGAISKGNSLYNIRNSTTDPNAILLGLLSEYQLLDVYASYRIARLAPVHIVLTADYVKNVGFDPVTGDNFDANDLLAGLGDGIDEQTEGWLFRIDVGWPTITKRGDWRVSATYKYLERDAVVDAYTDSDFHLGGTDGEGYILEFLYGLSENTWTSMRWLSSDEIEGDLINGGAGPLGVDTLQLDINARF